MPKLKPGAKFKISDNIEWRSVSPRSSVFYIEVRDHELMFVWTRGAEFSSITLIHTWQGRQTVTRVNCSGKTLAKCLNELTQDRGFLWKTVDYIVLPGRAKYKDIKPPKIVHFGQVKRGRVKGFQIDGDTRKRMSEAAKLRWAREKRAYNDLEKKRQKARERIKKKGFFSRSLADIPDDED